MGPRKVNKGLDMTGQPSVKDKTSRFGFNIQKDINLLRIALTFNPWQLGSEHWNAIQSTLLETFGYELTIRTIKDRVQTLLKKFEAAELIFKTGTEEQKTERGSLLEEVAKLVEEAKAEINTKLGDEAYGDEVCLTFSQEDLDPIGAIGEVAQDNVEPSNPKIKKPTEKQKADEERDMDFTAYFNENFAPEATGQRRKRSKLSPEDELIKAKQVHDMKLDYKKLELDEERQRNEFYMEKDRNDLDRSRFELERAREERLAADNKRRDDMTLTQLEVQKNLLALLASFKNP